MSHIAIAVLIVAGWALLFTLLLGGLLTLLAFILAMIRSNTRNDTTNDAAHGDEPHVPWKLWNSGRYSDELET